MIKVFNTKEDVLQGCSNKLIKQEASLTCPSCLWSSGVNRDIIEIKNLEIHVLKFERYEKFLISGNGPSNLFSENSKKFRLNVQFSPLLNLEARGFRYLTAAQGLN